MSLKSQPSVSVVIPVYNAMPYLKECLDSVCRQTLGNIEIILVNDGSVDGSVQLLKNYAENDDRIRVIHKKNSGKADACNVGIGHATGKYLCIPDADDILSENMLERLYVKAETTCAEIVKCSFYTFSEGGKCLDVSRVPQVSGSPLSQEDKSFFFFTPVLWNGLYRRDFLENRGIRLGGGRFHDDVAFHFMIAVTASHIETIDEPLYYYRTDNPQSMSKRISEYMSVFESLDYAEQNLDLSNELIQSIFYKYAFGKMVYGFKNVDLKCRKAFFREMRKRTMKVNKDSIEMYFSSRDKRALESVVNNRYWKWRMKTINQIMYEKRRRIISVRISRQKIQISLLNRLIVNISSL